MRRPVLPEAREQLAETESEARDTALLLVRFCKGVPRPALPLELLRGCAVVWWPGASVLFALLPHAGLFCCGTCRTNEELRTHEKPPKTLPLELV